MTNPSWTKRLKVSPEEVAESLLAKYWDGALPVDVGGLARKLGIDVYCMSSPSAGLSGQIERRAERVVIEVNANEKLVDQRFTVAHQIGHACLGHLNDQPILRDFSANASSIGSIDVQKEREANRFAGAFLMPKLVVDTLMRSKEVNSLFGFSERLGVSQKAAVVRLKQLGWM